MTIVQLQSDDAITSHQKPSSSSLSARRQGGLFHNYKSSGRQEVSPWHCYRLSSQVRLRPFDGARQAIANQESGALHHVQSSWDISSRLVCASNAQAVVGNDRPLYHAKAQILFGLWRARHQGLRPLEVGRWRENWVRMLSGRYGRVPSGPHAREAGQRRRLFSRELHLGRSNRSIPQPPFAADRRISRKVSTSVGLGRRVWHSILHAHDTLEARLGNRESVNGAYSRKVTAGGCIG